MGAGLGAARQICDLFRGVAPPAEITAALHALDALPAGFAERLGQALADEMPLLKRDGGFVRAAWDSELDEMRALRDELRKVIAGMERDLIEEPACDR